MKHLKMIALLIAVVLFTFSACKKDDDPAKAVEYSSVELSADNATITVTYNQGVYRNADQTGNIDAGSFALTFTATDTISAQYTAHHTAGESEVLINITYDDPPDNGGTLEVTTISNTVYGTEGNVLSQDLKQSVDVN